MRLTEKKQKREKNNKNTKTKITINIEIYRQSRALTSNIRSKQ